MSYVGLEKANSQDKISQARGSSFHTEHRPPYWKQETGGGSTQCLEGGDNREMCVPVGSTIEWLHGVSILLGVSLLHMVLGIPPHTNLSSG